VITKGNSIVYLLIFWVSSVRIGSFWSIVMKEAPFNFIQKFCSLFLYIFFPFVSFPLLFQRYFSPGNRQFSSFFVFVPQLFKCLALSQHSRNKVWFCLWWLFSSISPSHPCYNIFLSQGINFLRGAKLIQNHATLWEVRAS